MASSTAADVLTPRRLGPRHGPLPVQLLFRMGGFAVKKPLGFVGATIVVFFLTLAIFAPWVSPHEYDRINLRARLQPASAEHWLGTDQLGRDVLSRLIQGARLSMVVGFGAVLISSTFATALGLASAYFGGWFDTVAQRFVDAMIALPDLILLITLLGIVRRIPDANMILAMLFAIALLRIAPASRVVRSAVLELRSRPFIEAAEASGATPLRSMLQHMLPNVFPLILITATIALPGAILIEATLSFLGFGPAGEASWGQMLSVDGREYFRRQIGLALYPGLAIGLTVFGFNMFGDALRDILDPRLRGSR
jgi:peptide/nickel transport system permease protein